MIEDPASAPCVRPRAAMDTDPVSDRLDCRILVAEDNATNRALVTGLLRKAGAEVVAVENGQRAVEVAMAYLEGTDDKQPFDIILIDMHMPVMDGYDATRYLRQQGYTGVIIALTANAMASDRQKCIDAGCDDYASKPIDRQALVATIRKWLQKRIVIPTGGAL